MAGSSNKYLKIIGFLMILGLPALFFVIFGSFGDHQFENLPYYGPTKSIEREVKGKTITDSVHHTLNDFSFTDQRDILITKDSFADAVLIIEFFQERSQLKRAVMSFDEEPDIRFLSITVDSSKTEKDLQLYSDHIQAPEAQWHFTVPEPKKVEQFAINSCFKGAAPDSNIRKVIEHPVALLIDKDQHIRGVYDIEYSNEVDRLIDEIRLLMKEEDLEEFRKKGS